MKTKKETKTKPTRRKPISAATDPALKAFRDSIAADIDKLLADAAKGGMVTSDQLKAVLVPISAKLKTGSS